MKRTPLRRRSAKKRAADAAYAVVAAEAKERDGWTCVMGQAELMSRCGGSLHTHHILPRSRGGTHELDNLATLCRAHHEWVHSNPDQAKRLGLFR